MSERNGAQTLQWSFHRPKTIKLYTSANVGLSDTDEVQAARNGMSVFDVTSDVSLPIYDAYSLFL
jgi:hypothetical protein